MLENSIINFKYYLYLKIDQIKYRGNSNILSRFNTIWAREGISLANDYKRHTTNLQNPNSDNQFCHKCASLASYIEIRLQKNQPDQIKLDFELAFLRIHSHMRSKKWLSRVIVPPPPLDI